MGDPPPGPYGDHLDDVEATGPLPPPGPGEKHRSHPSDPAPLDRSDGFAGASEGAVRPGLHLDENDDGAIQGDEVDLAAPRAKAARRLRWNVR